MGKCVLTVLRTEKSHDKMTIIICVVAFVLVIGVAAGGMYCLFAK